MGNGSVGKGRVVKAEKTASIRLDFEDNSILAVISGEHNQNLARLEAALDVSLDSFGNSITISGNSAAAKKAQRALEDVYRRLSQGEDVALDGSLVDDALRWVEADSKTPSAGQSLETWKKKILAKTPGH